jgi:hypothetical protein
MGSIIFIYLSSTISMLNRAHYLNYKFEMVVNFILKEYKKTQLITASVPREKVKLCAHCKEI